MRSAALLFVALCGCYASHELPSPDAGIDSACAHPPGTRPLCCAIGGGGAECASDADCTDPRFPACGAAVAERVCWSERGCGFICASPDTPIATPQGETAIAELRVGDLVYSVDDGAVRAVPVARIVRTPVLRHVVVHVELASGRALDISAGHPTADGRTFGDLDVGDALGEERVASVELVPYAYPATYDILPASSTGTYFAAGALVGSTLRNVPARTHEVLR